MMGIHMGSDSRHPEKVRIDIYLVEKGFAPSRTKAQDLIKAGMVFIREQLNPRLVESANELIDEAHAPEILVQKNPMDKYVSRAGFKLEGALEHLQLSVESLIVLDVGISTGGFSDCLLQRGALRIIGIDVGHNQLSPRLKSDPRIQCLEGINAREIHINDDVLEHVPPKGFHLAVIDVSFISLTLVLPSVINLVRRWGHVLALVKPQFEVGPEGLGKNGIVKDESLYLGVKQKIEKLAQDLDLIVKDYFPSQIEGKDGNKEFFIYLQKN
jgi:23S rRNA (cytidine1920-2'-O)/16S rRNA (cytidine1409-2'-O)-methyltransferase